MSLLEVKNLKKVYKTRLGGNAVADIVVFGRIAAQNAAAYIAK